MMLSLHDLRTLTGGYAGTRDAPCPLCGPQCKTASNRNRKVLRIWDDGGFVTYKCARCEASGWARDGAAERSRDPRPPITRDNDLARQDRRDLARFLWEKSLPADGTLVETYLRSRACWLPSENIRFLPGRGEHPPAMIARFDEPAGLTGVHLTKLKPDGSGKAETDRDKIMIGPSAGQPIIVHDNPDHGEMILAEGIEDAASLALVTGWSAWAAGSAGRLAATLARAAGFERVFVPMDRDRAGRAAIARCLLVRPDLVALKTWRMLASADAADPNKVLMRFGPDALRAVVEWAASMADHARGASSYSAAMNAAAAAAAVFSALAPEARP